jgi:L,D-peptidoglycan transpeptidase YkuD (ErfK/YbiS/YcfS/YnhG family)
MSSHARPASPSGPGDPYASGEGPYGYGGHGTHGDEYNEYGELINPGRHTAPAPGARSGYGEAYGAPYQDGQEYADPGYDPAYAQQSAADVRQPAAYAEPPYAAPAAQPTAPQPTTPQGTAAHPGPRSGSRPVSRTGTRAQIRAAAKARSRRRRRVRNGFLGVGSVAAVAVIGVAAFLHPAGSQKAGAAALAAPTVGSGRSTSAPSDASRSVTRPTPTTALTQLPGLGPEFRAKVPANAQQVLLVTGTGKNANTSKAVLYTRTADGSWLPGTAWAAHNAKDGWTTDHMAGDLHSPIGVYSLTDAGGLDANPGTKLPYLHSSAFKALGTGFEGESLADAFDYVVAINYNHVPGTSPLSGARPMGASRGGGIWVHVDHGGPTHGCVSLPKADMAILLRDLDPSKHPVIVMGDATSLSA